MDLALLLQLKAHLRGGHLPLNATREYLPTRSYDQVYWIQLNRRRSIRSLRLSHPLR